MMLAERLSEYVQACFSGIWIESHEHEDALAEIAQLCRRENWRLAVWDLERGLQVRGAAAGGSSGGGDPLAAIRALAGLVPTLSPDAEQEELPSTLLVLVNFHRFLQSAEVVQALARQLAAERRAVGRRGTTRGAFISPPCPSIPRA